MKKLKFKVGDIVRYSNVDNEYFYNRIGIIKSIVDTHFKKYSIYIPDDPLKVDNKTYFCREYELELYISPIKKFLKEKNENYTKQ